MELEATQNREGTGKLRRAMGKELQVGLPAPTRPAVAAKLPLGDDARAPAQVLDSRRRKRQPGAAVEKANDAD